MLCHPADAETPSQQKKRTLCESRRKFQIAPSIPFKGINELFEQVTFSPHAYAGLLPLLLLPPRVCNLRMFWGWIHAASYMERLRREQCNLEQSARKSCARSSKICVYNVLLSGDFLHGLRWTQRTIKSEQCSTQRHIPRYVFAGARCRGQSGGAWMLMGGSNIRDDDACLCCCCCCGCTFELVVSENCKHFSSCATATRTPLNTRTHARSFSLSQTADVLWFTAQAYA